MLALGAEGTGLRQLTARPATGWCGCPQLGAVESLNVSVAAGMLLYEAVRQRMAPPTSAAASARQRPAPPQPAPASCQSACAIAGPPPRLSILRDPLIEGAVTRLGTTARAPATVLLAAPRSASRRAAQIRKEELMRHYEIVFLVHPDQSEQVPAMIER